ncbi:Transferrin receptor protein 2 [Rhynchospora pubera]|uniref:glutamate carboxypeptidase II n=1 Tax=Rhynchospora pubera TaxID=906938 RepID=A0AAV8HZZ6_9POAL|nr:Transferrin receptor protein 2 [Rhynchospora pubera]
MKPNRNPTVSAFSTPLLLLLCLITLYLITTISPSLFTISTTTSSSSPYHSLFLSLSSNTSASSHLRRLTSLPHIASSHADSLAASYVLSSFPFPSHSTSYSVLLSFPLLRSLSLLSPSSSPLRFSLTEIPAPSDPYSSLASLAVPTFHAYAHSGAVTAPLTYAYYGRVEDFDKLRSLGINVTGTVVLARYGKIFRGDIVKNSQDAGAAAVLVYSDYQDYAQGDVFPDGQWLPQTGVQRGSTLRMQGDPSTPGWSCRVGEEECERVDKEEIVRQGFMPAVPSLPISGKDGEELHKAIGGQVAPDDWQGREGSPVYHLGPGPGVVNLTYLGNETLRKIQNVFAVIEGKEEPDRYVLLGNHRDAWTFGAVDPNSGTASLLELAERLFKLQKKGWRPRRTIILCNWDAEEYGLIGSTEWVEENREVLTSRAVTYLNVDSAVHGPGYRASATPQLDALLIEASKMVKDPDNPSQTIYDSWISSSDSVPVGRLGGGGSDHAPFLQHIGVPSVDMAFGTGYPVYHSIFDDYSWMQKFGDPMFQRHVAAASIWGLVALRLADDEILPFDYVSYASELKRGVKTIEEATAGSPVILSPLYKSIEEFNAAATKINDEKKVLEKKFWGIPLRKDQSKLRELNDRLIMAERAFIDGQGLSGREWHKHLIYGTSKYDDYGSKPYPGIDDAIIEAKKLNTTDAWRSVQHEIYRAARAVKQSSLVLNGGLS